MTDQQAVVIKPVDPNLKISSRGPGVPDKIGLVATRENIRRVNASGLRVCPGGANDLDPAVSGENRRARKKENDKGLGFHKMC